jgi:hypothetical protein
MTVMVGFQLAVLIPVLAPVTTVETPVRSATGIAVAATVADTEMTPALYETLLAGSAGPAVGVNAVEMADVVHVVAPPRWSTTVTTPSEPDIELAVVEATCEPNETLAVGALMDNAPAVRVKVVGVAAETASVGSIRRRRARPAPATPRDFVRIRNLRILGRVGAEVALQPVAGIKFFSAQLK